MYEFLHDSQKKFRASPKKCLLGLFNFERKTNFENSECSIGEISSSCERFTSLHVFVSLIQRIAENGTAFKIGTNSIATQRYGRHFDHTNQIFSKISRESIDCLKEVRRFIESRFLGFSFDIRAWCDFLDLWNRMRAAAHAA